MTRKFWTIVVAALFIICLASIADAQRRAKTNRGLHAGHGQSENPGNQNENPGNGSQGENPGNGNQGETPQDPPTGTPDGETPAEEMTCDDLKNGTPGLYGLCIAFCEAHDCDPEYLEDGTLDFSHCKKNDGKLLYKYRDKMREGDPDMPCLPSETGSGGPTPPGVVTCPCWNQDDFDKFRYPLVYYPSDASLMETTRVECDAFEDRVDEDCSQWVAFKNYTQTFYTADYQYPYRYFFDLSVGTGECEDGLYCSRTEKCVGPECYGDYAGFNGITGLSQEDYDACMTELAELDPYCN